MIAQSCLHIRWTFSAWQKHMPREFNYYLLHPMKVRTAAAKPYLVGEPATFKQAVEEWVGREITDADLDRGIEIVNENRPSAQIWPGPPASSPHPTCG